MGILPRFDDEWWQRHLTQPERFWGAVLVQSIARPIPRDPRCKMCYVPFGGLGGKLFALARVVEIVPAVVKA